jgi:hypothetical protein
VAFAKPIFGDLKSELLERALRHELNSMDGIVLVYEEFMQQGTHFFLDL